MPRSILYIISLAICLLCSIACQEDHISFNDQIKPLLNKKCVSCHGGVKKAGGLSLLYREAALAVNEKSGKAAIVPGSAKSSELYKRIISDDPEYMMPRSEDHLLSDRQITLLKDWINEGAGWDTHWAYSPIIEQKIPVLDSDWASTDIDRFILHKLNEVELTPNESATKGDLWRRASLDVIGIPDLKQSKELGYEDMIDKLLADPSFGEHWASMWLDLARYADSHGYEKDTHRNIWRYRDWVINAFNADMPFDQFTIDQIAGDLVDPNDYDKLIATSFHRNSMTNMEGGSDDEEFRVAAVIDRLGTTFEVWQSTPIGCAQCHDHPYDPISQIEFYESMSLFNNTLDADLAADYPMLETFDEETEGTIDSLVNYISSLRDKSIDTDLLLVEKIKQALYPSLLPQDCDDFENALIFPNGVVCNWTNNVSDMPGRQFYFMYEGVDFDGLDSINIVYATPSDIPFLEARLDSKEGQVLFNTNFEETKSRSAHEWSGNHEWRIKSIPLAQSVSGNHDLLFEIQNPKLIVPEGILHIKQIDLVYKDSPSSSELIAAKHKLIEVRSKAEKTPVMKPKSNKLKRVNQLFVRGNQRIRADTVQEDIPSVLKFEDKDISNRLELAKWLVSKENPLTARVMVNRVWERIFGIGIVETLEDFGSMGEAPTNQPLLDHLAYQFIHKYNWSIKSLIKEIVISNTYRQSSVVDEYKLEIDPYNKLLARGARSRLTAEQIRDQVLYVSRLMHDSIGGESVMPPQPKDVWQTVYNNQKWQESAGEQKYRRGLYTYWKRSSPYPSMEAFDSPSREICKSRRIKTNTPNQALVTLNDPVYIEAANAMGKLMIAESDKPSSQIRFAYQQGLGKAPNKSTETALIKLYETAVIQLADSNDANNALISPAAVVAHAIFNLDGFLNKT